MLSAFSAFLSEWCMLLRHFIIWMTRINFTYIKFYFPDVIILKSKKTQHGFSNCPNTLYPLPCLESSNMDVSCYWHRRCSFKTYDLRLGVGDLFWKFIFSLNQAWKWFHSTQNPKYSFNWVWRIQCNYSFKGIWGKSFKIRKRPKYGFGALLRPLFGSRSH